MVILSIDPGEHSGWVRWDTETHTGYGGTLAKDLQAFQKLFRLSADVYICEEYRLYGGGMGRSQIGSTMYTCEAIGVIKFLAGEDKVIMQGADKKAYAPRKEVERIYNEIEGSAIGVHPKYASSRRVGISEHTKDAVKHLVYWLYIGGNLL